MLSTSKKKTQDPCCSTQPPSRAKRAILRMDKRIDLQLLKNVSGWQVISNQDYGLLKNCRKEARAFHDLFLASFKLYH